MVFFPTLTLVGVDGTPAARHALGAAIELCQATSSPLHLVHVKLRRPLVRGQPMSPPQRERADAEGQELLEAERAWAHQQGMEVTDTHLRYANDVHVGFVQVQDDLGAGLLIVGERGSGSLARSLAGAGTSSGTVRRANASVMVVRPPAG